MAESQDQITSKSLSVLLRRLFPMRSEQDDMQDNRPRRKGLVITLCFLAAVLLWFTVSMRQTYTQFFEFPTEVENLPDHLALKTLPPPTVRVQVEGEGIQLLRLYYNPPTIPINAEQSEVDLNLVAPELTKSVRTESIMPRLIQVETDTRVERRVPVLSRVTISTQTGYHIVGGVHLDPDSVTVSGAASIIDELTRWPTVSSVISQAKDSVSAVIAVLDSLSGLVTLDQSEVAVRAEVVEFTEGNRVLTVRVENVPPGQRVRLDPASTVVTYQVPIEAFDAAFSAEDFFALVPYDEILRDTTGRVYPQLHLPAGITLREVSILPEALGYYFVMGSH
jgi:YbbR-like protein